MSSQGFRAGRSSSTKSVAFRAELAGALFFFSEKSEKSIDIHNEVVYNIYTIHTHNAHTQHIYIIHHECKDDIVASLDKCNKKEVKQCQK